MSIDEKWLEAFDIANPDKSEVRHPRYMADYVWHNIIQLARLGLWARKEALPIMQEIKKNPMGMVPSWGSPRLLDKLEVALLVRPEGE